MDMSTLIAEDLLLLLLDDNKGTTPSATAVSTALGGAVLLELALAGAVDAGTRSRWKQPKVHVVDAARVTDPILGRAVRTIAEKDRTAQSLVNKIGKGLKTELAERMVKRGLLDRHDTEVLGIRRTRFPALDTSHKNELKKAITTVLVRQVPPDDRAGALIALLSAVDRAHKTVDGSDVPGREIKKRAKKVAEGAWAADAVRDAVAAATTAITTATIAAAAAGTSNGGG